MTSRVHRRETRGLRRELDRYRLRVSLAIRVIALRKTKESQIPRGGHRFRAGYTHCRSPRDERESLGARSIANLISIRRQAPSRMPGTLIRAVMAVGRYENSGANLSNCRASRRAFFVSCFERSELGQCTVAVRPIAGDKSPRARTLFLPRARNYITRDVAASRGVHYHLAIEWRDGRKR